MNKAGAGPENARRKAASFTPCSASIVRRRVSESRYRLHAVLLSLDLPTIFHCAVELAEAAAALDPAEWASLPVNIEGPGSPDFERWMERHRRLGRVGEETQRLKRVLGATGPLEHAAGETAAGPEWESFDQRFNNCTHDRVVRLALLKLATAAIDLSGFATWREWQWSMRETGVRLLTWGLAQLWEGMSGEERSGVRDRLQRTHRAIGWPADAATDPTAYAGPEEIPLPDQYRIISNYISGYRDYLDDVQKAHNTRVGQGQVGFLLRATLSQFVEMAERALQPLQAIAKRGFDTAAEWGDLYTKAFWPLTCLRRAHEVPPRGVWPAAALEQRKRLADAADILLTFVGGTPEANASLEPGEAEKALEDFKGALSQLWAAVQPQVAGSNWPNPTLDRNGNVKQVMYAHTMVGLSRGNTPNPAVAKSEWDALEAVSAGVPVDTLEKFDLWLEGTAHFFTNLSGDKDCAPWLEDACRIARRLDPRDALQPNLARPLDRNQALVELEAFRAWSRIAAQPPSHADKPLPRSDDAPTEPAPAAARPKRSTGRGDGREKLIAALTKHHQYADGSCLNLEPIGNNALARLATVSESTASEFFTDEFGGHAKYKANCRDTKLLVGALKLLNGEYTPRVLSRRRPAGEDNHDKEADE
jgi:hypothetical protein